MKTFTTLLLASTLAGMTTLTAFTPAALADQGRPGYGRMDHNHGMMGRNFSRQPQQMRGPQRMQAPGAMLFALVCSDRAAGRTEKMLDRTKVRLKLDEPQGKLFDDLKSSVLTAQTSFADSCKKMMAEKPATMLDRMNSRKTMMEAQLAGITSVTPAFEAFYSGLTDDQKKLIDQAGPRARQGFRQGSGRQGNGRQGHWHR